MTANPSHWLDTELVAREERNVAERDFQIKRMEKLNAQRRKLLDAYYAGAVGVMMLREEQERLAASSPTWKTDSATSTPRWRSGGRSSTSPCGSRKTAAPRIASPTSVPALYNQAVFETLIVYDGCIREPHYAAPFGMAFGVDEFEQGSLERETGVSRASTTASDRITFSYRCASAA